jgi:FkbM family methyltransferase
MQFSSLLKPFKAFAKMFIFPSGKIVTILRGPLKGCRYAVGENAKWSHIFGDWEPFTQTLFQKYLKPGNVVYDLGANTGMHSLLFSKLVGQEGKVYSFEPVPLNVREIQSLIHLNEVTNIHIVEKAISDTVGQAHFDLATDNWVGHLKKADAKLEGPSITVEVTTLDTLLEGGEIAAPDFIKIDIEGAESAALEGFSKSIQKHRPIFIIDMHNPDQDLKVVQFLMQRGYRVFIFDPKVRRQKPVPISMPDVWFGNHKIANTVLALPS